MTLPAIPPRDPQAEVRVRKALDRLSKLARALIVSGVITLNPDGTYSVNEIIQNIINGSLDDITDAITELQGLAEFLLEDRISRVENAVRFLGVEPNEFSPNDEFPAE